MSKSNSVGSEELNKMMTVDGKGIHELMISSGVKVDHWASDLYVPNTEQTREIIEQFDIHKKNAQNFGSAIDGTPWIDIPFAYDKAIAKKHPISEIQQEALSAFSEKNKINKGSSLG